MRTDVRAAPVIGNHIVDHRAVRGKIGKHTEPLRIEPQKLPRVHGSYKKAPVGKKAEARGPVRQFDDHLLAASLWIVKANPAIENIRKPDFAAEPANAFGVDYIVDNNL
jgi:hypothetical protein